MGNPRFVPAVTLDELARPESVVSGSVTFSDGESAQWFIDQMGGLDLDTTTPGYSPSEADLVEFETQLRQLLKG